MATMASLMVEVGANISSFVSEMTKIEVMARKQANAIAREFKGMAAGIGAALGTGMMVKFVKDTIDAQDQISKLSQKTGVTVESLSALRYAGDLAGVGVDALAKASKKMSETMVQAHEPTTKQAQLMSALKVNIDGGLMPALERVADVFASMPDGPTKTALAVELFGKAGMDMIPMLNEGSEGLRRMRQEAEQLGVVMSGERAKDMETYNDSLRRVQFAAEGATIAMTNRLAPAMVNISAAMAQAAKESGVLMALWVGLGGLASEALGLNQTEAEKLSQNLQRAQAEAAKYGAHLNELRKEELLKGLSAPGNMIESAFVAANKEIRVTQALLTAMTTADYEDQNDRRMRQGKSPAARMAEAAREAAGLSKQVESILSGGATKTAVGADLLMQMEQELSKLNNATKENTKLEWLAFELKKQTYKLITPAMKAQLEAKAKEIDATNAAVEAAKRQVEEYERITELTRSFAQEMSALVRPWEQATEQMQLEFDLLGESNEMRQRAYLLEKARIDLLAAEDSPTAQKVIRDELVKQLALLDQIVDRQKQMSIWNELAEGAARFAQALMEGPKKAIDYLKNAVRQLLAELVAVFAKRWVLQLGAMLTGNTALSAMAGQVGQGTIAGALGDSLGGSLASSALVQWATGGMGMGGSFMSGWNAVTMAGEAGAPGIGASGMMGSVGEFAAQAWQWAAANPVMAVAAVVVIAALAISRMRSGGPKPGGSFYGAYGPDGTFLSAQAVPGTDNGRFFTPDDQDPAMREMTDSFARNFFGSLTRLGGSAAGYSFGLGTDQDPRGSAANRVMGMVSREGRVIWQQLMEAGRDNEDLQRGFATTMSRMLLAGLQDAAPTMQRGVAAILSTVNASTATTEDVERVVNLAAAFADLMRAVTAPIDVESVIADASMTQLEALTRQGEALLELSDSTDITVDSLNQLTAGTNAYRQSTVSLLLAFEQVRRSIDEMFGDTIRSFELAGLDESGQYAYLQNEANRLYAEMMAATDPAEIQRLAQQVNRNMNAAFGMLSPEEQRAQSAEFAERARVVNETAQQRIRELSDQIASDATDVLSRVETTLNAAAEQYRDAATTQSKAAYVFANAVAAGVPVTIRVDSKGGFVVTDG